MNRHDSIPEFSEAVPHASGVIVPGYADTGKGDEKGAGHGLSQDATDGIACVSEKCVAGIGGVAEEEKVHRVKAMRFAS